MMTTKYYVNGFRECEAYFMRVGRFTESELADLKAGKVLTKEGNVFYMERSERA